MLKKYWLNILIIININVYLLNRSECWRSRVENKEKCSTKMESDQKYLCENLAQNQFDGSLIYVCQTFYLFN